MPAQKEVQRQYGIVIVAVVLALVVIGYVGYTYTQKANAPASQLVPVSSTGKGVATAESRKYNDDLHAFNQKNAASALKTHGSYLSALSTAEAPVSGSSVLANTAGVSNLAQPLQGEHKVSASVPQMQGASASYGGSTGYGSRRLSKEDTEVIRSMIAQWSGGSGQTEPYRAGIVTAGADQEDSYAGSMGGGQPAVGNGNASGAGAISSLSEAMVSSLKEQIVVPPYSVIYAELLPELDTDESSLVRVQVPAGMPYAGAVLFSSGYKLVGEDVGVNDFDAMLYQGRAYKITAKPLDMKTGRTTLSGDVHHHYFARIVIPAIANGIGTTAQAFQNAGTTSIVTGQGSVVSTPPNNLSDRNIAGSFIGGAGQSAGQVLTQAGGQIPATETIVHKDQMIGIQFIGGVTAADDIALAKDADNKDKGMGPARASSTGIAVQAPAPPPPAAQPKPLPGGLRMSSATPITGF